MVRSLRTRIVGSVIMVALSVGIVVALAIDSPSEIRLESGGLYEISCASMHNGSITESKSSHWSSTQFIFGCVAWIPWEEKTMVVLNLEPHESGLVATAANACDSTGERLLARVVFSSEDGYDHVLSEANMFECTKSTEELELKAPNSDED
ncbi:MAG: hypothetical protein F4Z01_02635 [Gammaproteobacteria bacterium]|nr:hypothetical protein [Gammaproteobacteria bacterium]MYF38394.1 hypothetical protein [Gammaproteobacteria bacterium]